MLSGRSVVIDCETTGLSPAYGDRMVSFAAIEAVEGTPSGRGLSLVFNPGRKCHPAARQVHGLSDETLSRQPAFAAHAREIRDFVGDALLVGHNVTFDIRFLNAEFGHCGLPPAGNPHLCTMQAFRRLFPAKSASLDAACAALGLDAGARATHHGAWIDACLALAVFQIAVLGRDGYSRAEAVAPTNFVKARARKPAGTAA